MIELELLGLHPDGDRLSLNDAEGNRYLLPITPDLRAALRKDVRTDDSEEPRPVTPKEIQAHFRAGLTMAEVSELTSVPPSQLDSLAHPILAERAYTATVARGYRQSQELGGMTLDELVISRLVPRGVNSSDIDWDAYRKPDGPWILVASYPISEEIHTALWTLDTKAQTVVAMNDEASWLTETQIPAPTSPWRPLNTPQMDEEEEAAELESRKSRRQAHSSANVLDAKPASAGRALSIDNMLDSLDSRRGQAQPMPSDDEFFDGAHPAASEPEKATDATILSLPSRTDSSEQSSEESDGGSTENDTAQELQEERGDYEPLPGQEELPGIDTERKAGKEEATEKPKKRRGRPEMPSWDEIVFGYSKDD